MGVQNQSQSASETTSENICQLDVISCLQRQP